MARVEGSEKIRPLTFNQELYFGAIKEEVDEHGNGAFVFGVGHAGTGKTYVATVLGAEEYLNGNYQNIIIIKPTVGPDSIGFLPGDVNEKMAPWLATVTEPLKHRVGPQKFQNDFGKTIQAAPLEYIRGKTFDNSFIIVDEAQNLTISQMKVVLTRIGVYSKMVFCADDKQCDLPKGELSGLTWFIEECRRQREKGVEVITFTAKDCVRSGACKKALKIIEAAYI